MKYQVPGRAHSHKSRHIIRDIALYGVVIGVLAGLGLFVTLDRLGRDLSREMNSSVSSGLIDQQGRPTSLKTSNQPLNLSDIKADLKNGGLSAVSN